jgi:hypothetical protein
MATIDHPTIAASEDMDCLFVLADSHAPNQAAAVAALTDQARDQWGYELRTDALPSAVKLWYKTVGDCLAPCSASDPEAESRWWVFSGVPADALELP